MGALLDRIKGVETPLETPLEIPDEIPEDWASELDKDPVPAPRRGAETLVPKTFGKVTPALKKRIAAELEAYIEFAAMPLVMRDPVCGGALHEQAKPMAEAVAQIMSRYPEIAHKFLATGMLGDWLKLFLTAQPVIQAVWSHHVVKSNEQGVDSDDLADFGGSYRPGQ